MSNGRRVTPRIASDGIHDTDVTDVSTRTPASPPSEIPAVARDLAVPHAPVHGLAHGRRLQRGHLGAEVERGVGGPARRQLAETAVAGLGHGADVAHADHSAAH